MVMVYRSEKGSPLTSNEVDNNFRELVTADFSTAQALNGLASDIGTLTQSVGSLASDLDGKQDKSAKLTALASLIWAANSVLMATGADSLAMLSTGAKGRELLATANSEAARSALALGSASVIDVTTVGSQLMTAADAERVRAIAGIETATVSTATDFNSYSKKGSFILPNVADNLFTNAPAGARAIARGLLVVDTAGASGFTTQILTLYQAATRYIRTTGGGSWAPWKQSALMGDNGIGVSPGTPGQVLTTFNAVPVSGFWRGAFANTTGGPSDAPSDAGYTCAYIPYTGTTGMYLLVSASGQWTGYFNGTTVAWTRAIKPGDYGLGDHMKFTSNMGAGMALSSIVGNGFFASSVQVPSDWQSDGGGGTYPMGFTIQATAALGLQVAAGNGSNALKYRVRGPSSFLDWRKIYDNANLIGVVSQSAGAITGAVFETGSNANGEYAKFADGTAICRLLVTTPDAPFTKLGNMYLSSPVTLNLPVTLRSHNDALVQGNDLNSTSMIVTGRRVTANTCQVQCMYPDVVSSQVRSLVVVVIGRWY